jgi:hypothetical protein
MTNPELTDDEQDTVDLLRECITRIEALHDAPLSKVERTRLKVTCVALMLKLPDMIQGDTP